MTLTSPPAHVAIVGGGLAGLTLALALHDVNIKSTIYEGDAEDANQGGGIMLSPNALRVLNSVGVYDNLRKKALEFDELSFYAGPSTERNDVYYFGSKKLYEYDAIRIMRNELLDELKAAVQTRGLSIVYKKKLVNLTDSEEGVKLHFQDGDVVSAPLAVGADGVNSTVRSSIGAKARPPPPGPPPPGPPRPPFDPAAPPAPIYSGFIGLNNVVPRSSLRIPGGYRLPATVLGPAGAFLLVPQKPTAEYSGGSELFIGRQLMFPWPKVVEEASGKQETPTEDELKDASQNAKQIWSELRNNRKQRLYEIIQQGKSDWPDIVQSALEATDVKGMNFWAFHGLPPLVSWLSPSSRTILVGDAAHAIPPTAGQGANQAFEDVISLAVLLSRLSEKAPLDRAAKKWQEFREERLKKVNELTDQMTKKRLPPPLKAKLPPSAFWSDEGLTKGDTGQLKWLYDPDLRVEANKWIDELESA